MKLILDTATASASVTKPSVGAFSILGGKFVPVSADRPISAIRLQSPLPADRERSSERARRVEAPAPGLGGVLDEQISRLEEANREWFFWRFGEDA